MSIEIICLEEHIFDAALGEAAHAEQAKLAPYLGDLGGSYQDDPDAAPQDRPRLYSPQTAIQLGQADLAERLRDMDACGIDMHVLSFSNPTQTASPDKVAAANDRMARAAAANPDRFAGYFALPWLDIEASVQEAKRAVRQLGLRAAMLIGRPFDEGFLDDRRFEPLLETFEDLAVPVYVHPGPPMPEVQRPYYGGFGKEVVARLSLYGWGWHNEAGIQVVRLILSGALDRHPRLRLISGHWGEFVPFFLQRMDDAMPVEVTGLDRSIWQTYRDHVYVTPSGLLYDPHFAFCRDVLGIERIMFSVDYPYLTMTGARAWLLRLPITDKERAAVAHRNAGQLFSFDK